MGEIGGGGGFAGAEDRLQIDSVALTGLAVDVCRCDITWWRVRVVVLAIA